MQSRIASFNKNIIRIIQFRVLLEFNEITELKCSRFNIVPGQWKVRWPPFPITQSQTKKENVVIKIEQFHHHRLKSRFLKLIWTIIYCSNESCSQICTNKQSMYTAYTMELTLYIHSYNNNTFKRPNITISKLQVYFHLLNLFVNLQFTMTFLT